MEQSGSTSENKPLDSETNCFWNTQIYKQVLGFDEERYKLPARLNINFSGHLSDNWV